MLKRITLTLLFLLYGSASIPVIPANSTSSESQLVAGYKPKPKGGMPSGGGAGTRLTGGQDVGNPV